MLYASTSSYRQGAWYENKSVSRMGSSRYLSGMHRRTHACAADLSRRRPTCAHGMKAELSFELPLGAPNTEAKGKLASCAGLEGVSAIGVRAGQAGTCMMKCLAYYLQRHPARVRTLNAPHAALHFYHNNMTTGDV